MNKVSLKTKVKTVMKLIFNPVGRYQFVGLKNNKIYHASIYVEPTVEMLAGEISYMLAWVESRKSSQLGFKRRFTAIKHAMSGRFTSI